MCLAVGGALAFLYNDLKDLSFIIIQIGFVFNDRHGRFLSQQKILDNKL
jgi:hypothetical protein